jgi:hypothetical protein
VEQVKTVGSVLFILAALSWLLDIVPFESREKALNTCQVRWIEVVRPEAAPGVAPSARDRQYLLACMGSRGFVTATDVCASDGGQLSDPNCFKRRWPWT